jgi:hypothetical protein
MALLTTELADTIAARWRHELKGKGLREEDDGPDRTHWRTKVSYYRAMEDHLLDDQPAPLTWQEIVERVTPKGSRTTFYLVIGSNAAHPLLREYRADRGGRGGLIAESYARGSAVQQLLDETKVWSYWAYRTGWLTELGRTADFTRRQAAECLVRVLTDWAVRHPETARALDHCPPVAAVEDLLVVWDLNIGATAAHDLLRDVIIYALGPLGTTTDGVLYAVRARLDLVGPVRPRAPEEVLGTLAEAVFNGIREISAMPETTRARTRDAAVTAMEDAIADLQQLW